MDWARTRQALAATVVGLCAIAPAAQEAERVHALPLIPSVSDASGRQGFVRVINHSAEAGDVRIEAIDDEGKSYPPIVLSVGAGETVHFTSRDLEIGSAAKGLSGGVGSGEGDWRLELSSALDIEVLAYLRTADGFVTSMHDTVPSEGGRHRVAFFNPGSNNSQVSRLRLVNPGEEAADVSIAGIDDRGVSPGSEVTVTIPAGASRTFTAAMLESGGEGFEGALGDGEGKWRLTVESAQPLVAMSLLSDPTGRLNNLSTATGWTRHSPADLVVMSLSVSNRAPIVGATLTLSATVRNAGDSPSPATVLRYYRSADSIISTSDTRVGANSVGALRALGASAQSVSLAAPLTAGVYYFGACVDEVAGESDTTNNCSSGVRVNVERPARRPNLAVSAPTPHEQNLEAGETFTLSATVTNAGDADAPATMLRFHRSADATVTSSDTQVGSSSVEALSASGSSAESVSLRAPLMSGTYYYGACVDAVTDESDTSDNCSAPAQVNVKEPAGPPDLEVGTPSASSTGPRTGSTFTLSATVRNAGAGASPSTTLRYYRSADATISVSDAEVGTDDVGVLLPAGTSAESLSLTAPSTEGAYYYGACVDAVAGETDTTDNCSASVQVNVRRPPTTSSGFDIDIVYVDPQPSDSFKTAINAAAALWERAVTSDLTDVDFASAPRNNRCTDGEFDGYVDDVRVYVHVVEMDGVGGTTASAGRCTTRSGTGTPVIARIRFDSSDISRLSTGTVRLLGMHELTHVLGFGVRWGDLRNRSLQGGVPVTPPPDTHWPGTRAVAAFNAAGGEDYQGGKVPVENALGGAGSQDAHWRLSVMPGELMTYNLDGGKLSAITLQSLADLGYSVNASAADSYTVPDVAGAPLPFAAARAHPFRCEVEVADEDYVP